ncbi:MAG: hypothetical protein J6T25_02475 [Bacilli bacterium]|nr:hypothetical protein [Bacilli bacterium]
MNKKGFLISTLILGGLLTIGSFSSAYALFTQNANNANFGISQDIDYYLKGSFNSWEQNNTYKFVNNTAGMTAEENKIKEYKLENIPLNKAAELKVWANNDVWYQDSASNCTYEHRWSDAITYSGEGHNYIVPMTSKTYSFYLKFYNDGSSKLYITANKDILYFIPSSNWTSADATFAIKLYDGEDNLASTITESVENPAGTFKFDIGSTYTRYQYVRRNTTNSGDWNWSNILTVGNSDTNNCFELWNEYWGGGEVWSDWDPNGGSTPSFSNGVWSAK